MDTNPDIGKLCWTGSGSLAYSKTDSSGPLIFKDEPVNECVIKVQFGNQSWVCRTYNCYHEIHYSATGSGSGITIVSSYSVPDCAEFRVKPRRGSASSFTVSITAETECAAISSENPGANCSVSAAQKGATPRAKGNISCRPNVAVRVTVSFDTNGKLTGVS